MNISQTALCDSSRYPLLGTFCDFIEGDTTAKVFTVAAVFFSCLALRCWTRGKVPPSPPTPPGSPVLRSPVAFAGYVQTPKSVVTPLTPDAPPRRPSASLLGSAVTSIRRVLWSPMNTGEEPSTPANDSPESLWADDSYAVAVDSDDD